ncbi:MAG: DUF896 domain-containing protein [Erysipelotrichaceae bacterium]|nr:DUF896 domain-containing protein [Erysipelotrichaceae bacterium]
MRNFMEKLIERINFLANKKKTVGLTEEETIEQQQLRQEYLKIFREGFKRHLTSIKVVDQNGNDVTPQKLKDEKKKMNEPLN